MPFGSISWRTCGVHASQVFNVEATGQYRKLFKLYAIPAAGGGTGLEATQDKVDIREVRNNQTIVLLLRDTRGEIGGRVTPRHERSD